MKYQKQFLFLLLVIGLFLPALFNFDATDTRNAYNQPFKKSLTDAESLTSQGAEDEHNEEEEEKSSKGLYIVVKVVDGDTVDVEIEEKVERIRMIGVNTPETVDPRKPVECFGKEASNKTKEMFSGKRVYIETDPTQGLRDKYGRLLAYVFLEDGTNYNLWLIDNGYAYEYTYNLPYKYQAEFKMAQKEAMEESAGLWSSEACDTSSSDSQNEACDIKGNINKEGQKIYHLPGQEYYDETVIDENKGEAWFCSEAEAQDAGWRKAQI